MADKTQELNHFVYAPSSYNPILAYGKQQIQSQEGFQQDDPLSSLGFCDAIHPTLTSLDCTFQLGFINDSLLSGKVNCDRRC